MDQIMGRCEIINSDKNLEVVFFPKPLIIGKYWETSVIQTHVNKINDTVNRNNPESKIQDYFDKSKSLIRAVRHREDINKITGKFGIVGKIFEWMLTSTNMYI